MNTKKSLSFLTVVSFMLLCSFTPAGHNRVGPASPKAAFAPFSPCPGPTNLRSAPQLGYSSVKWAMPYPGATYEFECYYSGDTPGSCQYLVESFTTTSNSAVINTDLPGYYDWQVRYGCPDDGMSSWSYASFYVPAD